VSARGPVQPAPANDLPLGPPPRVDTAVCPLPPPTQHLLPGTVRSGGDRPREVLGGNEMGRERKDADQPSPREAAAPWRTRRVSGDGREMPRRTKTFLSQLFTLTGLDECHDAIPKLRVRSGRGYRGAVVLPSGLPEAVRCEGEGGGQGGRPTGVPPNHHNGGPVQRELEVADARAGAACPALKGPFWVCGGGGKPSSQGGGKEARHTLLPLAPHVQAAAAAADRGGRFAAHGRPAPRQRACGATRRRARAPPLESLVFCFCARTNIKLNPRPQTPSPPPFGPTPSQLLEEMTFVQPWKEYDSDCR
jgi:hypothetical protein